jgi:hypothetical protein
MRGRFFLLLLLLFAGTAHSQTDPTLATQIAARVHSVPVLHGAFTQERQIAGFSKPLKSEGHFVAAQASGVIWDTQTPFPGRLVITADGIRESAPDSAPVRLDAAQEPALKEINRIMLAVLQGDLNVLQEHFDFSGAIDAAGWRLVLTPRGAIAQAIGSIEVCGMEHITRVQIDERNGDRSEIVFSAFDASATALSADETRAFAD